MRYLFFILIFLLTGCSNKNINILLNTGKRPPTFFQITDIKTMNEFVFDTQKFSFKLPLAKKTDFIKMGGWSGESMRDGHTIAFSFSKSIVYSIVISTGYKPLKYGKEEKAIEAGDIEYIKNIYHQHNPNTNISLQRYGKENYPCIVIEKITDKQKYPNKEESSFQCYKLNSTQTKAKYITLILTYNKPNDPVLAKEYTYEDLKERAKRVLDSLYIKDGWDK